MQTEQTSPEKPEGEELDSRPLGDTRLASQLYAHAVKLIRSNKALGLFIVLSGVYTIGSIVLLLIAMDRYSQVGESPNHFLFNFSLYFWLFATVFINYTLILSSLEYLKSVH